MAKTASGGSGSVQRGEETAMVNGARRIRKRRRRRNRAALPVLPDELILWEILVRLPAKELFRCRAACRSWRRVTSDLAFLLAHHRFQPSLPLVEFEAHNSVHAFDLRRPPAVSRPVLGFNYGHSSYPHGFTIYASCDGLLLLSFSSHLPLHLCNPATRQWLTLRNLSFSNVAALYPHRPSGEYRILYWNWKHNTIVDFESIVYYVLTVGSSSQEGQQQRCIGLPVASPSMKNHTVCWRIHSCVSQSVLLHDCLHWYNNDKIIVFDTVAETFRWMQSPTTTTSETHVLQMDGTLGVAHVDLDAMNVVVWVLQDHEKEIWSTKYRIKLPQEEMRRVVAGGHFIEGAVVSENGDTLLIGGNFSSRTMFHCDGSVKFVRMPRFLQGLY